MNIKQLIGENTSFVFVGEAGSGKSEVALNFALWLQALGEKPVHFFDLDMTKPLFRSRDLDEELRQAGVNVHFQEQFMDAPTLVGGVRRSLKDAAVFTVLDVGGDHIGARSVGGFASELNREGSLAFYVLNVFRPWSARLEHIDETMGKILGVSRIAPEKLNIINNPNQGYQTTLEEFLAGSRQFEQLLGPDIKPCFSTARREVYDLLDEAARASVFPLRLFIDYDWND